MANVNLLNALGKILILLIGGSTKLPVEEVWIHGFLELNHVESNPTHGYSQELHQFIIWEYLDGKPYVRQYLMDTDFFRRRTDREVDKIWEKEKANVLKEFNLKQWPDTLPIPVKTTYYQQSPMFLVIQNDNDVVFMVYKYERVWKIHLLNFIETNTAHDRELLDRNNSKNIPRIPVIYDKKVKDKKELKNESTTVER